MSSEITVKEKELSWTNAQIELIKRTVAKGSTDDEFNMFMYLAKTYQLDPIIKEIWFIKYKDYKGEVKTTIMTSRDGYLAIANRNSHYQGLISDVVHENDEFEKLPDSVRHKYGCKNRGKIIGAYALGYRDDRKYPVYVFANFDEYFKKNSSVWEQYSSAMILKVSEAMMFKRLFSISGLVTTEEIAIEKENEMIIIEPKDITPKEKIENKVVEKVIEGISKQIEETAEITKKEVIKEAVKTPLGTYLHKDEPEIITEEDIEAVFPKDFKPATEKQKNWIYGKEEDGKHVMGIVDSHLINAAEVDQLGSEENLSFEDASKFIGWWVGNKEKGIVGEREKRGLEEKKEAGKAIPKSKKDLLIDEIRDLTKSKKIPKLEIKKVGKLGEFDLLQSCTIKELEIVLEWCKQYGKELNNEI